VHCSVVPINGIVEVTLTTDGCSGDVKFIEHVEALVTMSASVRGQVHHETADDVSELSPSFTEVKVCCRDDVD